VCGSVNLGWWCWSHEQWLESPSCPACKGGAGKKAPPAPQVRPAAEVARQLAPLAACAALLAMLWEPAGGYTSLACLLVFFLGRAEIMQWNGLTWIGALAVICGLFGWRYSTTFDFIGASGARTNLPVYIFFSLLWAGLIFYWWFSAKQEGKRNPWHSAGLAGLTAAQISFQGTGLLVRWFAPSGKVDERVLNRVVLNEALWWFWMALLCAVAGALAIRALRFVIQPRRGWIAAAAGLALVMLGLPAWRSNSRLHWARKIHHAVFSDSVTIRTPVAAVEPLAPVKTAEAASRPSPAPSTDGKGNLRDLKSTAPAVQSASRESPAEALVNRPRRGTVGAINLGEGAIMNMVFIPAGIFAMGSPESEPGRFSDEGPVTAVTLTEDFWMSATEVTQAQWQAVMGGNPAWFRAGGEGAGLAHGGTEDWPVESVSWEDAMEFCRRLTARVGHATFTLPTEAQWEYACRAGSISCYAFGGSATDLDRYAWHAMKKEASPRKAGSKLPNAWGLYDMSGNVWEWCLDTYSATLPGGQAQNPVNTTNAPERVARGGCFLSPAEQCRSAARGFFARDKKYSFVGFRVISPAPVPLPAGR